MSLKKSGAVAVFRTVYVLLIVAFSLYIIFATDMFPGASKSEEHTDLSMGWYTNDSTGLLIDMISAGDENGGDITVRRKIPASVRDNDCLCLSSNNSDFEVYIDGEKVYGFASEENLTGYGYGTAYHTVNLSSGDAHKTISIDIHSSFPDNRGGHIGNVMICSADTYRHIIVEERGPAAVMSFLLIVVGLGLLVISALTFRKFNMPYNFTGLACALILIGLWSFGDTHIPQLLTGKQYLWRAIDYFALHLAVYPMIYFETSLTVLKRKIYPVIAFIISGGVMLTLLAARFFFGRDMSELEQLIYFDYLIVIIISVVIFAENLRYCRKRGIGTSLNAVYLGACCFLAGIALDLGVFSAVSGKRMLTKRGPFMLLGLTLFAIFMIVHALRWWMRDQTSINRDRFINRMLQMAISEEDPEKSIDQMLEYIGTEYRSDRAYIFEDMGNGTFDNTYEWCRKGVSAQIGNLKGLPYAGAIDAWYNEYRKSENILIYDIEEYRKECETMYNILKPQGIKTLVTGPLEIQGKYIGFFGLDNPPPEIMRETSEIISLLSYILAHLVQNRTEQDRLVHYSYYDTLTGCRNRRALEEYEERNPDHSHSFGFVVCDLNGLKQTNDIEGHKAGDAFITDISTALLDVFGEDCVYRTGGDEFVVYSPCADENEFDLKIERFRKIIADRKRSAAIGAVFSPDGDDDYIRIQTEADAKMYEDKRRYYMIHERRKN